MRRRPPEPASPAGPCLQPIDEPTPATDAVRSPRRVALAGSRALRGMAMQAYSTVHSAVGFPVVSLFAACYPAATTVLILVSRFHGPCRSVAQIGISPRWVDPIHTNRCVLPHDDPPQVLSCEAGARLHRRDKRTVDYRPSVWSLGPFRWS